MKKYLSIYFLMVVTSIGFSGCTKNWIETRPNGAPATIGYWNTDNDINKGILALYAPFQNESTWGRDLFWMQNAGDDMVVGRSNANAANIKNLIPTGREGYMAQGWVDLYGMINMANQAIQNIPDATQASDAVKQQALGEAYFIRGFSHFWLAYLWGTDKQGVPFDRPENAEFGKRIPPQLPTVMDNYEIIVSDLQKAADMLPLFSQYKADDYGRAHKVAAWGYIVKTYAYWAQYDKTKWQKVSNYCDTIADKGQRALITGQGDSLKNYQAVFKIDNNWGPEYIWSVTSGVQGGSEFPGVVLENKGWGVYNGWGYFQPTEELYDEYESKDPRRTATILKFGDSLTYFGRRMAYSSTNSLTGFQINKYMDPYSYGDGTSASNTMVNQNGDYPTTRLNLPLMRYAEILLFKAEAELNLGNTAAAAIPLNQIRTRVGLSSIANPTMDDLKHERRCELACEWTDRFQDLKRWGDFSKIEASLHGRNYVNKSDPKSNYTIIESWPARTFDKNKDMAWPINPDEISKSNGAYHQTPGW
ncbi:MULTISPECIES: RagB/SusD family nutrient uptake outer membrane protein [Chitinophagaceae]